VTIEQDQREQAGRKATAGELKLRLAGAGTDYLRGALDNPALSEEMVVLIVKNPAADQHILHRIGEDRTWARSYKVKRAVVRHPKTPHALAMNLVKFLFWRDLHLLSDDQFIYPPLRIHAEKTLLDRLPQMALGEKMTFGRIAGRAAISRLLADKNPTVVEAVLWNGRLTSQALLSAISDQRTPAEVLAQIARHPKWTNRGEIRAALAHNIKTPLAVSLGLLSGLPDRDLAALVGDSNVSQAVKMACRRVLAENARKRGPK